VQTIVPARKQLFCKPDEAETKTSSGFLLSKEAAEKPKTAQVINVGRGVDDFKAHDKIVYKPYTISEVKVNGDDYFIVAEEDVLGKVLEVAA
jgi:chaperonin GroES